jgi:uncharacterized protein (DUF433 family)
MQQEIVELVLLVHDYEERAYPIPNPDAFPGISFRDSLSEREAYLTGHRVAVWEVVHAHEEFQSVAKTAEHFHWPAVLVERALAYASEFPDEIKQSREGERPVGTP